MLAVLGIYIKFPRSILGDIYIHQKKHHFWIYITSIKFPECNDFATKSESSWHVMVGAQSRTLLGLTLAETSIVVVGAGESLLQRELTAIHRRTRSTECPAGMLSLHLFCTATKWTCRYVDPILLVLNLCSSFYDIGILSNCQRMIRVSNHHWNA